MLCMIMSAPLGVNSSTLDRKSCIVCSNMFVVFHQINLSILLWHVVFFLSVVWLCLICAVECFLQGSGGRLLVASWMLPWPTSVWCIHCYLASSQQWQYVVSCPFSSPHQCTGCMHDEQWGHIVVIGMGSFCWLFQGGAWFCLGVKGRVLVFLVCLPIL